LAGLTRGLAGEAERLAWMGARGLPVPAVEALIEHDGRVFVLLAAVEGFNAAECAQPASAIVETLAAGLRLLHGIDARACPFDAGIAAEIEHACRRLAAGLVDERDFDAAHAGGRPPTCSTSWSRTRPASEDLVLTHGDYCLPNVILRGPTLGNPGLAGFVDVGRAASPTAIAISRSHRAASPRISAPPGSRRSSRTRPRATRSREARILPAAG